VLPASKVLCFKTLSSCHNKTNLCMGWGNSYSDRLWSRNRMTVTCWYTPYTPYLLFVWGLVYFKWLHQNSYLLLEFYECSVGGIYQFFRGTCCLHLLGLNTSTLNVETVGSCEALVNTSNITQCVKPSSLLWLPVLLDTNPSISIVSSKQHCQCLPLHYLSSRKF
jgi:hypothetical protein